MTLPTKKVFISYSWTTPEHEDWVLELAQRLRSNNVDVVLDKWDLNEGDDKYHFMEQSVSSDEIEKVLIILDEGYAKKANGRAGGVGTETLIISPKLYGQVVQDKFIPIVAEVDHAGKAFLPVYLESRIYIDMSTEELLHKNYESLLRRIFNRPSLIKPPLGETPRFLLEEHAVAFKTGSLVMSYDYQIDKHPQRINSLTKDFLDVFYASLSQIKFEASSNEYSVFGKELIDKIKEYIPLREDYIAFLTKVCKDPSGFDVINIINLFEKLPLLLAPRDPGIGSWNSGNFYHIRYIIHELFLVTIAVALKNGYYALLEELLYAKYIIRERHSRGKDPESFLVFYNYLDVFNSYYRQIKGNSSFEGGHGFVISELASEQLGKEWIISADLLAYYISSLYFNDYWYPITAQFRDYYHSFELLSRLYSNRHFEKVKGVLGADTISGLKQNITALYLKGSENGYSRMRLPMITHFIKAEDIGTSK